MFENPRTGRQARNFKTNVPKILDLKSSSEQIRIFRKLTLGAPEACEYSHLSSLLALGTDERRLYVFAGWFYHYQMDF